MCVQDFHAACLGCSAIHTYRHTHPGAGLAGAVRHQLGPSRFSNAITRLQHTIAALPQESPDARPNIHAACLSFAAGTAGKSADGADRVQLSCHAAGKKHVPVRNRASRLKTTGGMRGPTSAGDFDKGSHCRQGRRACPRSRSSKGVRGSVKHCSPITSPQLAADRTGQRHTQTHPHQLPTSNCDRLRLCISPP